MFATKNGQEREYKLFVSLYFVKSRIGDDTILYWFRFLRVMNNFRVRFLQPTSNRVCLQLLISLRIVIVNGDDAVSHFTANNNRENNRRNLGRSRSSKSRRNVRGF